MIQLSSKERLTYFLQLYFYELEILLKQQKEEIAKIKFQSEEANTDEFFKIFIKKLIKKHKNIKKSSISKILITKNKRNFTIKTDLFNEFTIKNVYLPNDLTPKLKKEISSINNSVYTNPDLLLKISGYNETLYESIELKSTKNNTIPGSSVQQVNPYEWVIFLRRQNNEIITGQYINSITEKLPFPDRSPRPMISFKTLAEWNKLNRVSKEDNLVLNTNSISDKKKLALLKNWQAYLTDEWLAIIKQKEKQKSEKWFNNALRMFAVKLLNYSKDLKENELDNLIHSLNNLVDQNKST